MGGQQVWDAAQWQAWEDSCICQLPLLLRRLLATRIQPGPGQCNTLPGAGLGFSLTQTGPTEKSGGLVITALVPTLTEPDLCLKPGPAGLQDRAVGSW